MQPASPSPSPTRAWIAPLLGISGGIAFTGTLAAGLALFSRQPAPRQERTADAVVSIPAPEPPPPPPAAPEADGVALPPAPLAFDSGPAPSTVQFQAIPLPAEALVQDARPAYVPHFDYAPGQFNPRLEAWKPAAHHVYQPTEVDQRAVAIFRKVPEIPNSLLEKVRNPRVRLLLVVNTDGTVQDVRVLHGAHPEFDRLIVAAVERWRFRPAIRRGQKVRCLAELPVLVRAPSANPFAAD